ncbi:uncharacterized protein [Oryza sativa Japonica Group]|uniref:uncharacterized protein n=1 Tax=Oryza sativa subsp. japonica TaxID=39947 RepID=UPI00339D27E7
MTENGVAHSHEEEENELLTFYKHHLGESRSRSTAINYSFLQEQSQDLTDLEDPFTEDEIKQVIFQARSDNAPGPDGFTGAFFNKCWEIIQEDVVLAINQVANHDTQSLWLLNSAYIALLPKRTEALQVTTSCMERVFDRVTLSPMLFILAIDPLQKLLARAQEEGLLQPLHKWTARLNVALYADDVVVFTRPDKQELHTVQTILHNFGISTGMVTNLSKSEVYAIRCEDLDLQNILSPFPAQRKAFPCTYLGLPLHIRKLKKSDVQPLIDRFSARLPTWKGKLLNKTGRSSLPTSSISVVGTTVTSALFEVWNRRQPLTSSWTAPLQSKSGDSSGRR